MRINEKELNSLSEQDIDSVLESYDEQRLYAIVDSCKLSERQIYAVIYYSINNNQDYIRYILIKNHTLSNNVIDLLISIGDPNDIYDLFFSSKIDRRSIR